MIDHANTHDIVDPERIALSGWSLGGNLAPRAASGEHRLAACIADPGSWSVAAGFRTAAIQLGVPPHLAASPGELPSAWMTPLEDIIAADPKLRWSVMQRGFWVHGVRTLRDYLAAIEQFNLDGRVESIRCPTLITVAQGDSLSGTGEPLYDALRCPKQLVAGTANRVSSGLRQLRLEQRPFEAVRVARTNGRSVSVSVSTLAGDSRQQSLHSSHCDA